MFNFRSLKIYFLVFTILAMVVSASAVKAEPITTGGSIAIGSWLLNFFSAQPQRWQTSNGTFEVRIEVPEQYRDQLSRVRYLYPCNHENLLTGQGQVLRLIAGWSTQISAFFPTGEKDVRKNYWRVDNGAVKGEFKDPPYRFDLPFLDDVVNSHFIEIGVGTGRNSGGSISAMYRCNTLEGYYAEMLANSQFATLTRDEFVKKEATKPAAQSTQTVSSAVIAPETPVVAITPSPAPVQKTKYGEVSFRFLNPQGQPEAVKTDIQVGTSSGTCSLYGESRNGEWITVKSVPCDGSAIRVKPRGSKIWSKWHYPGERFEMQRGEN